MCCLQNDPRCIFARLSLRFGGFAPGGLLFSNPGRLAAGAGGTGSFCQHQAGHDLSDALRSSEDLAGVADRVWNCLNLVPGLQALRLYHYPWAACLGNCACISSWQKHIRGTTAPIHLDGHPLHRVRSSHTAQTKTPLRGFFGRESLSEARAHRLESRGDLPVQASKVAHQTAGLEDHVSFPLPEMRVAGCGLNVTKPVQKSLSSA